MQRCGMDWPAKPYVVSYGNCWKCRREIPFFRWEGLWSKEPPPQPRPSTVQFRYLNTTKSKYWANTCPNCKSIQGDWFVFSEPGGAFLPTYDEAKSAFLFAQDMGILDRITARL